MGTKKLTELIVDAFILLVGVVLFISAQGIDTGSALGAGSDFVPKLCTGLWIAFAVCLLVKEIRALDDGKKELGIKLSGFILTLVLLFAYVYSLTILGFTLASVIYLFIQMMIFVPAEYRTTKNIILFAVISIVIPVAVNYLFVNAFSLLLPEGTIFA